MTVHRGLLLNAHIQRGFFNGNSNRGEIKKEIMVCRGFDWLMMVVGLKMVKAIKSEMHA